MSEHFAFGLRQNTLNLTLFLTYNCKHCERIVADGNSTVMSVNVFWQVGSGFVTKHNFGCKTFVRGLHLKTVTEKFVGEWSVVTFWESTKFEIKSQNFINYRLWRAELSCWFWWTAKKNPRKNLIHFSFSDWSYNGTFSFTNASRLIAQLTFNL